MPTPPMNPRTDVLSWWGTIGAQILFAAADGDLVGLTIGEDERLVGSLGVSRLGAEPYRPERVRIDADEVETTGTCAGVDVRVRHSFDNTWQVRIGLTNRTDQPAHVGRLLLDVAAGPDGLLRVHPGGATGFLTFHRIRDPECLALRLTRGDLVADDGLLGTPELTLEPGGRYQLTLSGDWYASAVAVRQRYPIWFPDPVDLDAAEEVDWEVNHPDAGVVRHELGPEKAASRVVRVDVSDAAGVTRVDVAFVDEAGTYAHVAREAVARGRLVSAAEGLCVHRAYADQRLSHDEARTLITDYALEPPDEPGPMGPVLLARAHDLVGGHERAGDLGVLHRAIGDLAGLPPGPGVPLAWLSVWAAAQVLGEEPEIGSVGRQVAPLLNDPDPVTHAEAILLLGPGPDPERCLRELDLLCSPLPGDLWPLRADADRARAIAVRSLLRPTSGAEQPDLHLPVRRLVARSSTSPDGIAALAWLTLRAPTM